MNLKRKYNWDGSTGYTSFTSPTPTAIPATPYQFSTDFSRDDSYTAGSGFTTGYLGGYTGVATAAYGSTSATGSFVDKSAAQTGTTGYSYARTYGTTDPATYATTGTGSYDSYSYKTGTGYQQAADGSYTRDTTYTSTLPGYGASTSSTSYATGTPYTRDAFGDTSQKWYTGGYGDQRTQTLTSVDLVQYPQQTASKPQTASPTTRDQANVTASASQEGYWGVQNTMGTGQTWNQQIPLDNTYGASPAKIARGRGGMREAMGMGDMPMYGPGPMDFGPPMRGRGWGFFPFRGRGMFRGRGGRGLRRGRGGRGGPRGRGRGGSSQGEGGEGGGASAEQVKSIAKAIMSVLQGGKVKYEKKEGDEDDDDDEEEKAEGGEGEKGKGKKTAEEGKEEAKADESKVTTEDVMVEKSPAKGKKGKTAKAADKDGKKAGDEEETMEHDGDGEKDVALQRKVGPKADATDEEEKATRMKQFVDFFKTFPDRVNGIQTISNAVTSSKLNLTDEFEAFMLITLIKPLFTGTLFLGGYFITRGLGLSKKAVKHDCYERAVQLLRTKTFEEITKLEDCGTFPLNKEIKRQYRTDYDGFRAFLFEKGAMEMEESEKVRVAAQAESQVPERNFPLSDKMAMLLKEMEKPGMDEVPITSRADVLCFKVGIAVTALYKSVKPEEATLARRQANKADLDIELICEIYFDDVLVGTGKGCPRKAAQVAAYEDLFAHMKSEPMSKLADGTKMDPNPERLPGFVEILHKGSKQQNGNNHHRLGALRLFPPDQDLDPADMVIMESEGDSVEQNAYKILEFSASKSGMLLEWKQLDKGNTNASYRCEMTLQQKKTVIGIANAKAKARNAAAAQLLLDMYETHDVIRSTNKEDLTKAISFAEIRKKAEQLKAKGTSRAKRITFDSETTKEEREAGVDAGTAADAQKWFADKLRPWLEDSIVNTMEEYSKKVTLEDLVFGTDFPPTARRFITYAALQLYLTPTQRSPAPDKIYMVVYKRLITPREMVKILHVNNSQSGRYTLVKDNTPFPAAKQKEFVSKFPDLWKSKVEAAQTADKKQKKEMPEGKKK